jgi:hypothetical protein
MIRAGGAAGFKLNGGRMAMKGGFHVTQMPMLNATKNQALINDA